MDYALIREYAGKMYECARNNDRNGVYASREYYREGVKSPTMAMMILQDESRKRTIEHTRLAAEASRQGNKGVLKDFVLKQSSLLRNQLDMDGHSLVADFRKAFIDKMDELYPKTAHKRVAIIDKRAVVCDKVVPKFTGFKKFFLAMLAKKYAR